MTREEEISNESLEYMMTSCIHAEIYDVDVRNAFEEGAKWADRHSKHTWINIKDDLPCNHEELILTAVVTYLVLARLQSLEGNVSYVMCYMCRASKDNEWVWQFYKPGYRVTHWMRIPKLVEE